MGPWCSGTHPITTGWKGAGERLYLIAMIDDTRFARQDSTAEDMRLLWIWVERYGRLVEAYTDQAGLFETNRPTNGMKSGKGSWLKPRSGGRCGNRQSAGSRRARRRPKGRVERFFKTAQDRLVKGVAKPRCARSNKPTPTWN